MQNLLLFLFIFLKCANFSIYLYLYFLKTLKFGFFSFIQKTKLKKHYYHKKENRYFLRESEKMDIEQFFHLFKQFLRKSIDHR